MTAPVRPHSTSIAAVVNLHREGSDALPSLISAWRAVERARARDIEAQLVLVLDSPDAPTEAVAAEWESRAAQVLRTEVSDLGAARNVAAERLDADWLAFLDGDDLWGEDWLVAAHAMATANSPAVPVVFHPTVNIIFGDHHSLLHHIDSTDPAFLWSRFHLHNAWTALSFVKRQVVVDLPYPRNDLANGFGFEDWSWNMAVLDAGGEHRVVPDTCHFIRRVDGSSLLDQSQEALRTQYPSGSPPERASGTPDFVAQLDPGTHREAMVELSEPILHQVGLAATIEPTVQRTMSAAGNPRSLPQNFNDHYTAAQRSLEELWAHRKPDLSVAEICENVMSLVDLDADDRTKVVAEFLRTERQLGRTVGESPMITEALNRYSQLLSPRDRPDTDT